ncbi:MAG: hypothetical protein Q4A78_12300 [Peptostreptococcaceae bacterium]|nr:hypothetical protein [Peptostreptococcaceae bacterium]
MNRTGFLFSEPSFWEGVGRLFDWAGTLSKYNDSKSSKEADYKAIQSDWRAIGDDIREAIEFENGIS